MYNITNTTDKTTTTTTTISKYTPHLSVTAEQKNWT